MPPVLDPSKSKVDGLAFVGLSLTRWSPQGHPDSQTHQTAFDFNDVLDREYIDVFSTNDDGWLVGGGEPGPPQSYKLAARDSGHVEIMRIGTYRPEWGGLDLQHLLKVLMQQHESGAGPILIPQIEVVPTAVVANPDTPPELEIRFDMEPEVIRDFDDLDEPLPLNWQLRFLHNQLFKTFVFPSRFCPGAFHSTILRKAEFRSVEHRTHYFAKCNVAIAKWRTMGPQPLNTIPRGLDGTPLPMTMTEKSDSINAKPKDEEEEKKEDAKDEDVAAAAAASRGPTMAMATTNLEVSLEESGSEKKAAEMKNGDQKADGDKDAKDEDVAAAAAPLGTTMAMATTNLEVSLKESDLEKEAAEMKNGDQKADGDDGDDDDKRTPPSTTIPTPAQDGPPSPYQSGLWLFTDRENISHFFAPNFLPPYDTPEKKRIILDVLREEWDEVTLSWKPNGQGSMTKNKAVVSEKQDDERNVAVAPPVPTIDGIPIPSPVNVPVEPTVEAIVDPSEDEAPISLDTTSKSIAADEITPSESNNPSIAAPAPDSEENIVVKPEPPVAEARIPEDVPEENVDSPLVDIDAVISTPTDYVSKAAHSIPLPSEAIVNADVDSSAPNKSSLEPKKDLPMPESQPEASDDMEPDEPKSSTEGVTTEQLALPIQSPAEATAKAPFEVNDSVPAEPIEAKVDSTDSSRKVTADSDEAKGSATENLLEEPEPTSETILSSTDATVKDTDGVVGEDSAVADVLSGPSTEATCVTTGGDLPSLDQFGDFMDDIISNLSGCCSPKVAQASIN